MEGAGPASRVRAAPSGRCLPPPPSWSPPVCSAEGWGRRGGSGRRGQEGRADCAPRVRSGRTAAAGTAAGPEGGWEGGGGGGQRQGEGQPGPWRVAAPRKDETVSGCRGRRGFFLLFLRAAGTKARAGVSRARAAQLWGAQPQEWIDLG